MRKKSYRVHCLAGFGLLAIGWMAAGLGQTPTIVPLSKEYVRLGSRVVAIQNSTPATDTGARNPGSIAAYNPIDGYWVIDLNGNFTWDGPAIDRLVFWRYGDSTHVNVKVYGDWNGDGRTKIGVYSDGIWLLDYNGNNEWDPGVDLIVYFGGPGYTPVVGDWNGTGWSKIGAYKNTGSDAGTWLLDYNGNFSWDGTGTDKLLYFGGPDYIPVVGDWNGTGWSKIGAYNNITPNQGIWLLDYNGNFSWDGTSIDKNLLFGGPGYTPVVGDWNGKGSSKIGAYNEEFGTWVLDYDGSFDWLRPPDVFATFGGPGYSPVFGDWNGSGIAKIGVYNKDGTGTWLMDFYLNYILDAIPPDGRALLGGQGYEPVVGIWQ